MKPFPLNQLDTCADGQALAMVAGTIKKLFPQKTGESQKGPWSIQNAILTAPDGSEVPLFIKDVGNLEEKTWKGKSVVITAKQGNSLSGIYVMDDEFNDKTVRKLKITKTAEWAFAAEQAPESTPPATLQPKETPAQASQAPAQASEADQAAQAQAQAQAAKAAQAQAAKAAQAQAAAAAHAAKTTSELHDARRSVLQIANLHLLCQLCVERYEAPTFKDLTNQDMTESQRQGAIGSIFIEACKSGQWRKMPASNLANHPDFTL